MDSQDDSRYVYYTSSARTTYSLNGYRVPGLSSFGDNIEGISTYLAPLLEHARTVIPPSLQPETPLFLLATAGMRLLPPNQQAEVLRATCHFLKFHSHFRIDNESPVGPCGSSVRIITGEEEGLFGWIAINYLMDSFTGPTGARSTYGFLDMGGASTQIAFEPDADEQDKAQNLIDVRLRTLDGQESHHKVFVTTWLGYGTNQARERYVEKAIAEFEASNSAEDVVLDPCLPKDLELPETSSHTLFGTGSFEQCLRQTSHLLNKDAPCPDSNCLFNGVYVPPLDFAASQFIGISEYWYSTEDVFDLGGPYDFVQYERAASEFCARDWTDIVRQHEQSRQQGTLGGDGEVLEGGEVVATGKWGPQVEIPRLQMQCFKAAWIVNVLHEGLGMPRIVDPEGNISIDADGEKVAGKAQEKGLGKPTFQSMDSVGDIAISWTLGKMVLEASKEVPAASASVPPLVDPLDDISANPNPPVQPIRPPFLDFGAIEDKISHHLPASLSRESLGFSIVALFFYSSIFMFVAVVCHRLRHRIRSTLRRMFAKKGRNYETEEYSMEEGQALTSNGAPPSPRWPSSPRVSLQILQPLGRLSGSFGRKTLRPPPINVNGQNIYSLKSSQSSPPGTRASPSRSYSYPSSKSSYGLSVPDTPNGAATAVVPGSPRCGDGNIVSNGSVSSLTSRSRNSSQMNLSSFMSRQTISRTASGSHMPAGSTSAFFRED